MVNKIDQFKRDLYQSISQQIHKFEAETGQTVSDIELAFCDVGTVDEPCKYFLNEIHIELVNRDGMCRL